MTAAGVQRLIRAGKIRATKVHTRLYLVRREQLTGIKRSKAGRPRKTAKHIGEGEG